MDKPTIKNEYAALDFDGTERRANYRTVAYRIDILHLCERKDAAAILYEIIYRWQTEVRKPEIVKEIERRKKASLTPMTEDEVEGMMWVWMSYNDFVRESGGAVAYNTVIRMLDYLVEDVKIVECRENHDPRYPDYEYRIRLDTVKSKLKALPATPAFLPKVPKKKSKQSEVSTQVGTVEKRSTQKGRRAQVSTQVGTDSTQKGIATTQDGREVYPNGGTSHTTTHTSHIEHTEEDTLAANSTPPSSDAAIALSMPAQSSSQDEDEPYQPDFTANEDRDASHEEAWDVYRRIEPQYARTNQMLATAPVETPELSTLTASSPRASAKVENKPKRTRAKAVVAPPEFTANGRKVYDAWCSLFKSPPRAAEKTIECADALYPRLVPWCQELKLSCKDLLDRIQKHLYKTDTSGFYKRGVTLCDIDRDFEKWQSAMTQELTQKAAPKKRVPTREEDPYSIAALLEEQNPGYFARKEELETWTN